MEQFDAHLDQVYQDYIHDAPVPVPVSYNLQRESHKLYGRPISVK